MDLYSWSLHSSVMGMVFYFLFYLFGYPLGFLLMNAFWVFSLTIVLFGFIMVGMWMNSVALPGAGDAPSRSRRSRADQAAGGWYTRSYMRHPRIFRILLFFICAGIFMVWNLLWWYGLQPPGEVIFWVHSSTMLAGLLLSPVGFFVIRGLKPKAPQPDRARSKLTGRLMRGDAGSRG